jgi:prepilin-type processing-associated H-X9-DG protein
MLVEQPTGIGMLARPLDLNIDAVRAGFAMADGHAAGIRTSGNQ